MIATQEKTISEIYRNGMMKIAAIYVEGYKENPEREIEFIKKFEVPRKILKTVYGYMIREGLTPIENLGKEEKENLWIQSDKNLDTVKAIYILKTV